MGNPEAQTPAKRKYLDRKYLPDDIRLQISEKWVLSEMAHRDLVDPGRSKARDGRATEKKALMLTFVAAGAVVAYYNGRNDVVGLLVLFGAAYLLAAPVFYVMQGATNFYRDSRLYLYNLGVRASGTVASVRYTQDSSKIQTLYCTYSFQDGKGETFHGQDSAWGFPNALPYQLERGDALDVLYHPGYPLLNTMLTPANEKEFCLRRGGPP